MPLPIHRAIELPLIKEIAKYGGKAEPAILYKPLANFFGLTVADMNETVKDGEPHWNNTVRFVRQTLVDLDVIDASQYGVWKLTEIGKKIAEFIQDVDFTRQNLETPPSGKLVVLNITKETFEKAMSLGVSKKEALLISGANDCKSIKSILGYK